MDVKIIILIAFLLILIVYFIIINNKLIKLNNQVKEAFSTMDVYLKKRWDLIPNIVEVVKGYAKHEEELLKEVTKIRASAYDKMTIEEKINTNEELANGITKIMILAEKYPELKANSNFKDLSNQLVKVEDEIAQSRKYYNATVRILNNKVEMFPSNIVAKILGYQSKTMFKAEDEEKSNIEVKL